MIRIKKELPPEAITAFLRLYESRPASLVVVAMEELFGYSMKSREVSNTYRTLTGFTITDVLVSRGAEQVKKEAEGWLKLNQYYC